MSRKNRKMKKSLQKMLLTSSVIPMAVMPFLSNVPVAYADSQIPELTAYQNGNAVKLEWSTEILDSDVLYSSSFEDGQHIPGFMWGWGQYYSDGKQSITTEDKQHGLKAFRVENTIANGNHINWPNTYSPRSIMSWGYLKFPNGTPLSLTFYAKTDSSGTIIPYGDGGWSNSFSNYEGVTVAQDTPAGSNTIKLSSLSGISLGGFITTDTDPQTIQNMYQIKSIDQATNTITLNTGINRAMNAGEQLKTRRWRSAFTFNERTVNASDGWKRFSINTFVANFPDYDVGVRGGTFYIDTMTSGKLYIDNARFGFASEAIVYRDGQQIYKGLLSDYNDTAATDKAQPNAVSNVTASMSGNKPLISWTPSTDNGTSYSYTIKGVGKTGESPLSAPKTVNVNTGIKGYSVVIDQNPTTVPDATIETTSASFQSPNVVNSNFYAHIAAVDNAGNVSAPMHVQYTDTQLPNIALTSTIPSVTNQDIVLQVQASDDQTGVKRIQKPDGTWINGSTVSYTVSQNGTYNFVAEDYAGNQKSLSINVTQIDKIAPGVATLTPSTTAPTKNNVSVTIAYPADAVVKEYKVGASGAWTPYTTPVSVSANGAVYARSKDAAGNISAETSIVIANIDKIAPTNPSVSFEGNTLTVQAGTDGESGVLQTLIQMNGGAWQSYSAPIQLADGNYNINVKTVDKATNESSVVNVQRLLYGDALKAANEAVELAKSDKTQAHIDSALALINQLPGSAPEKQELTNQITQVQHEVELTRIHDKIIQIKSKLGEGNLTLIELQDLLGQLEDATSDLNAIPNTVDKGSIATEISEVQKQAELAEDVMELTESSESDDIESLEDLVNQLPDGELKDSLLEKIQETNNKKDAIDKVGKLEDAPSKEALEDAKKAVSLLPDSPEKEELLIRIQNAEKIVLATDLLSSVEGSFEKSDYDKAMEAIQAISNETVKNELLVRLESLKPIVDAVEAVKKAEKSRIQADINAARQMVNGLSDGDLKEDLYYRLDRYDYDLKIATSKVRQAETSLLDSQIANAEEAIAKLVDSPQKQALFDRIQVVKAKAYDAKVNDAEEKVALAESFKRNPYLANAWAAVSALSNGEEKNNLIQRLQAIQSDDMTEEDQSNMEVVFEINSIADANKKAVLTDALKAVERAEKYTARNNIVYAINKVEGLADSIKSNPTYASIMKNLQDRTNKLKTSFNDGVEQKAQEQALNKATTLVEMYEKSKSAYYKRVAQEAVNALPDGVSKSALQARIDAVVGKK